MSAPPVPDSAAPEGHASGQAGESDVGWLRVRLVQQAYVFDSRYEVVRETANEEWSKKHIGTCGQGLIVQVRSKANGKLFALKMAESGTAKKDLERELKICAELDDHEYVAMFLRLGRECDRPCYITHFAEHLNLERYIGTLLEAVDGDNASVDWSEDQLIAPFGWLYQISCGLTFLHFRGIIHCDMKPKNILVYEGGPPGVNVTCKICDFGFAIKTACSPEVNALSKEGSERFQLIVIDHMEWGGGIHGTGHGGS